MSRNIFDLQIRLKYSFTLEVSPGIHHNHPSINIYGSTSDISYYIRFNHNRVAQVKTGRKCKSLAVEESEKTRTH